MRVSNKSIITNGDMSADITSPAYLLDQVYGYSIQAVYTGTPNGALKLQVSCDPGPNSQVSPALDQPSNWDDLASSNVSVVGAGSWTWNVDIGFYEWVRVVYTEGGMADTGTLNVRINTKGV